MIVGVADDAKGGDASMSDQGKHCMTFKEFAELEDLVLELLTCNPNRQI